MRSLQPAPHTPCAAPASHSPLDHLCTQLGIRILGPRKMPLKARQTRARQSLAQIMKRYGEGHLVLTLKCITDSGNEENAACLSSDVIMAVSDVLYANPHYDQFGTGLLDAFAGIDLKALRDATRQRFRTHLRLRLETLIGVQLDQNLAQLKSGRSAAEEASYA